MSAIADADTKNAAPLVPVRPRWRTGDHEFLPAALEILETPPSPVRMALLLLICAFVVAALVWSYVGRIDIIAVAQGKIQPTGSVKVVQPLETGKVQEILIANGKLVKAGDVLVRLDPSEAEADVRSLSTSLASYRAEALRRRTTIATVAARKLTPIPPIAWADDMLATLRVREERVLQGDLNQIAAVVAGLEAQRVQKRAEAERLRMTIAAQKHLIEVQSERVAMRQTLVDRGAGPRITLLDALESQRYQETILATQQGQLAEAEANILVLGREIDKTHDAAISENSQKLADAERQADDYEQRLAKARAKLDHMVLTSPIDGMVQALSLTTVGQVVTTGAEMMRIVPGEAAFEIECYLPNKDVGFVKAGQDAVIKVEAFPFTRYGSLSAKVTRVATDAIPEPDAQAIEGNPASSRRPQMFATADRTQNLVFPITLAPDATVINADGVLTPLSPGMAVSAEIKTGSRRIIEFVFSPLVEISSKAFGER
jgi:hemolysin D